MTSKQVSALGARIADTNMRSQTKAKVDVRKVNLDPSQEAQVVLCLRGLGTKFVSFGRRGKDTVVVIVLSSIRRSLQLRLQKTTSVGRARTRGRRRRRVTVPGHRVEVPTPRRALRVSRTKGENHLPQVQLQFACCAL